MTSRGNPNYIKYRQQRIKELAKLLNGKSTESHEQIIFKFAYDNGLTVKKVQEYYQILTETGMVKKK